MRPRVFIGSSVESLPLARAIQAELSYDFEITIWSQGIFKLSNNALEDLEGALDAFDYGIFVFEPNDILKIRNRRNKSVRDNVIFEFGLFIGKLGKHRVFFLVPEDSENLHLPSDLLGIKAGKYFTRRDGNLRAAVAPFCDEVRERGRSLGAKSVGLDRAAMFQDLASSFASLFDRSTTATLFFIHSRSWRENNHGALTRFLNRSDSNTLNVILPNFLNADLLKQIVANFEDGAFIPKLIEDAVTFFVRLRDQFPKKVKILVSDFYPTYSFYKFDESVIVAFYPTTDKKRLCLR